MKENDYDYYFDVSPSSPVVSELQALVTSAVTGFFALAISISELVDYINLKKKERSLHDLQL